jgi:flagellar basal-body rod protein FlgB
MMFTDAVTAAVERALSGVSERQRVTANNIANVSTPGFKASRVNFEESLADAIRDGRPEDANPSLGAADTPARADGNNVSLDDETKILVKSGLQYQALVQALNYKLNLIRTAVER